MGTRAFAMFTADWLSQCEAAGPDCSKPGSFKTDRRYLACLAASTAAMRARGPVDALEVPLGGWPN